MAINSNIENFVDGDDLVKNISELSLVSLYDFRDNLKKYYLPFKDYIYLHGTKDSVAYKQYTYNNIKGDFTLYDVLNDLINKYNIPNYENCYILLGIYFKSTEPASTDKNSPAYYDIKVKIEYVLYIYENITSLDFKHMFRSLDGFKNMLGEDEFHQLSEREIARLVQTWGVNNNIVSFLNYQNGYILADGTLQPYQDTTPKFPNIYFDDKSTYRLHYYRINYSEDVTYGYDLHLSDNYSLNYVRVGYKTKSSSATMGNHLDDNNKVIPVFLTEPIIDNIGSIINDVPIYDGDTQKNDISKPSRSNINSTPTLPTYYNLSGISGYNLYQIPIDQLDECVSYLNSGVVVSTASGFLTWIKLLARIAQYAFLDWINNRNDYIISWKMTYYTPTVNLDLDPTINVGATSGIQIANHHITQQYDTIDCGNISVEATSFTDYEPYTYYEIYLPFVGTVPLRADTIAGRTINVKYVVDNVSNESTCIISTIDGDVEQIIHTYECNLGIDIPYKSFDYLGNIRRNASALVSAVASGASVLMKSKSNAYARSALASTSSAVRQDYLAKSVSYENIADSIPQSSSEAGYEQPQCIRSNVGSSLLSSMLPRKPYLMIRRVPMYSVNDSNRLYGRPTLEFATLDNYEGSYVKVRQVRLDGLTCTDEEKDIIGSILESGVIL